MVGYSGGHITTSSDTSKSDFNRPRIQRLCRLLEGFRGAIQEKLEWAHFDCESKRIGDFLGAFEDCGHDLGPGHTAEVQIFTRRDIGKAIRFDAKTNRG